MLYFQLVDRILFCNLDDLKADKSEIYYFQMENNNKMKQHRELIVINMIQVLIRQKNVENLRVTYSQYTATSQYTAADGSEYNILVRTSLLCV